MAKKRKERSFSAIATVTVILLCLIAFSLAVRWLDIGWGSGEGEIGFQIEVMNGTGETGVAMKTATALRRMGIDVLIVGDAEEYGYEESLLVDRKGNPKLMKELARRLGVERVVQQIQEHPLVDATLIIGKDKDSLKIGES
jgi:hypothetical protein